MCNADCMDILQALPDKSFQWAIIDPPYGRAQTWEGNGGIGMHIIKKRTPKTKGWTVKYASRNIDRWDSAPPEAFWKELFRVSEHQIVWGGNYFHLYLPTSRGFCIWDKQNISPDFSTAQCEYAWVSKDGNSKIFPCVPQNPARFHPCQKPLALYNFLITHYTKEGDRILDTHAGSGVCGITAFACNRKYLGIEINEFYYEHACQWFNDTFNGDMFLKPQFQQGVLAV